MDDDAALYDDLTTIRRLTYYMNKMENTYKGLQDMKEDTKYNYQATLQRQSHLPYYTFSILDFIFGCSTYNY